MPAVGALGVVALRSREHLPTPVQRLPELLIGLFRTLCEIVQNPLLQLRSCAASIQKDFPVKNLHKVLRIIVRTKCCRRIYKHVERHAVYFGGVMARPAACNDERIKIAARARAAVGKGAVYHDGFRLIGLLDVCQDPFRSGHAASPPFRAGRAVRNASGPAKSRPAARGAGFYFSSSARNGLSAQDVTSACAICSFSFLAACSGAMIVPAPAMQPPGHAMPSSR